MPAGAVPEFAMSTPSTPNRPPGKPRATIEDVARAAAVALGTVSRVLNHHADVSPGIRDRVLTAARTLNYTRLRQRKEARDRASAPSAGNVGVLFFGMEDTLAQLPVVSLALQGVESALAPSGRSLMLASVPKGDRLPPFLADGRVEGVILKGPNQGMLPPESECELLAAVYRLPHVWLMGRLPNAKGDHCNFDTELAGRLAVDHVVERGHRRLAFFDPKPGQNQFERLNGACRLAAARHGLAIQALESEASPSLAWPLPAITIQEKVSSLVERWAALPARTRPTALIVPSDRTTVQLYGALERRGLRVGRDVSVVSCNNERSLLEHLDPLPTTIDVHAEAIGRRAVEQLLWRIDHPDDPVAVQLLAEPALVEGGSVAAV